MINKKIVVALLGIFLLFSTQNIFAQNVPPALEAHVQKAIKSLAGKDFESWKNLFPNRETTIILYNNIEKPEWKTPASNTYLRRIEEDLAYIKIQRFYTKSFLEALQSGREMHSGNMEPIGSYDWADMQIEKIQFDSPEKESASLNILRWRGAVLLKNKKDNKQYTISITNILEFQHKFWGIEFQDMEEWIQKSPKDDVKYDPSDALTTTDTATAIDTLAAPAYAPAIAETESEYTGTVGTKKIIIYWTDIETEGVSRTEVAYVYAGNPTYTYFSTEDLQNHNFILTEPESAAFWHVRRVKNSITGIRILPDGSVQEKVMLNLKSSGKQVHKK